MNSYPANSKFSFPNVCTITNALKTLTAIICLIGFFANNFAILKQFASGKTILSINLKESEALYLPAIVICNFSAYIESKRASVGVDDYLNNTLKLSNILLSVTFDDKYEKNPLYPKRKISDNLTVESVYSYYRGHCYLVRYSRMVIAQESLIFKFKAESDLWIYVMEPGDEFFLHLDYWPEPMQPILRIEKNTKWQDVAIRKTEIHKHEKCRPVTAGRYADCLRGYFEIQQRNRTKTGYPNCTTPWHQSILEGGSYTRANTKSCNETEKQKQLKLIETFMKNSGSFRIEQCPEPCEYIKYDVKTLSYDKTSHIEIVPDYKRKQESEDEGTLGSTEEQNEIRTEKGGKEIMFYYSTTSVSIASQEKILDFSNFLSAIGGNLGLFIGFSFFGFFSCLYDLVIRLWAGLLF